MNASISPITDYKEVKPHYCRRIVWYFVNATLFRLCATRWLRRWRNILLRLFGAKVHPQAHVYASVKVFAPWNLVIERCLIGPNVILYNKALIHIGMDSTVSQRTTICTASHNVSSPKMELVIKPVTVGDQVWIASEAFVSPGVELGEGVVVGTRAAVFRSVEPWTIVGGNPAKEIKKRILSDS